MSSTLNTVRRRLALAAAVALASVYTGCTTAPAPAPEPFSTTPLVIDQAMQKRDWPRTEVGWANGDTPAGATRFPYAPQTEGEGAGRAVFGAELRNSWRDSLFFVGQ